MESGAPQLGDDRVDRRRSPRDRRQVTIALLPTGTLKARPPFSVVLLDVSRDGLGLITSRALAIGSRFRVTLDLGAGGGFVHPHYVVRNCAQAADGVYKVGAEFTGHVDAAVGKGKWSADEVATAVARIR